MEHGQVCSCAIDHFRETNHAIQTLSMQQGLRKVTVKTMALQSGSILSLLTWLLPPSTGPVLSCTISMPMGALHLPLIIIIYLIPCCYIGANEISNYDVILVHILGTQFHCWVDRCPVCTNVQCGTWTVIPNIMSHAVPTELSWHHMSIVTGWAILTLQPTASDLVIVH